MKNISIFLIFTTCIFCIEIGLDANLLGASEVETYNSTISYSNNENLHSLLYDYVDTNTYTTGPGDVFLFNMVTSNRIVNLELLVSPSGTILIPIVGVIDVKDKTLNYVYDAIIKKCKSRHEDAYVYVELIKTRLFKVLITGDFSYSGMFAISATNRVSDLFESIYDFKNGQNIMSFTDSLLFKHLPDYPKNILLDKDIFLIRDSIFTEIDLFNYYINGDLSSNPTLREGDIINIKNSNKIAVLGEIKNPIRIDKPNNITYADLLKLGEADNKNTIKVINYKMLQNYSDNEINRISEIESKYRSDVDESFLNSRLKTDKAVFSVFINKNINYQASPGDIIIVENVVDYIEIIGGIKNPGTYKYNSEFNINNYINQAGDFSQSAKNKNIYIINQENGIRNKVDISYNPQPGDIIFIEEKVGFKSWERFSESIKLAGTLSTMSLVIYNIWDKMSDE
tara:strand:+ start:41 stop:1402 length:1362 start_codon:yes stop_codon:yes gene_type:complete